MPRILAIDWDRREARALVVQSGPTGTSVVGAWTASLETADGAATNGKQIGTRLAAAMSGFSLGKVTTVVGVGRDHVQMKLLSLPPAPPEELPDLVRFQAEREFTALGDDAALDYIPLTVSATAPQQVLAVSLGPSGLAEAREVCDALGVEAQRLPLRAAATAALVLRGGTVPANSVVLVVNPLTDEADLTVIASDLPVLMRTVRLPDSTQDAARQRALVGEIRRTSAAVRQQLTDRQVDQVMIVGDATAAESSSALAAELGSAIVLLDPIAQAPSGIDRQAASAESLNRFGAVLGMALSEVDRRTPVIDFLNVRRAEQVSRFTRVHALAAATAALVLLAAGYWMWSQLAEPTREIERINQQLVAMQPTLEQYDKMIAEASAIERWLATGVPWLDELVWLSRGIRPVPLSSANFPVTTDAVVQQLIMARPGGLNPVGGQINVQEISAKSDSAVAAIESRLRDGTHTVETGGLRRVASNPAYPVTFGMKINVPSPEEAAMAAAAEPVIEEAVTETPPAPAATEQPPAGESSAEETVPAAETTAAETTDAESTDAETSDPASPGEATPDPASPDATPGEATPSEATPGATPDAGSPGATPEAASTGAGPTEESP